VFPVCLAPVVSAAFLSWLILGLLSGPMDGGVGSRSYSATGRYTAADDELAFDLPGSDAYVYVPPTRMRQAQGDCLLAVPQLTGAMGPEAREGLTTTVPLRFDLTGRGEIRVTGWRVTVHHQPTGLSQSQREDIDPRTGRALILFTGLPTGRYDVTVEMLGWSESGDCSSGTGNLQLLLTIAQDASP